MTLSPRQTQCMQLVCRGLSNDDIAAELGLSKSTVKVHVTLILARLGAKNRAHAAALFTQAAQ